MGNKTELRTLCKLLIKLGDNCISNISILQYIYTKIYEILTCEHINTSKSTSTNTNTNTASNSNADSDTAPKLDLQLHEIVSYFADANNNLYETNFIRAINSTDKYIMSTCNHCYSILLSIGQGSIKGYCTYMNEQLQSVNMLDHLLTPLTIFLQKDENRKCFLEQHGIKLLSNLLSKLGPNGNAQYIYELVFSLWTVSLCYSTSNHGHGHGHGDAVLSMNMGVDGNGSDVCDIKPFLSNGIIPLISELLAAAPSKKVIRMCIAVSTAQ